MSLQCESERSFSFFCPVSFISHTHCQLILKHLALTDDESSPQVDPGLCSCSHSSHTIKSFYPFTHRLFVICFPNPRTGSLRSFFLHLFAVTLYSGACRTEEVLRARIIDA